VATAVGGGFLLLQVWIVKMHASYSLAILRILLQSHLTYGGKYLFLFQIANHSGYVQVDWRKVEKDVNKAKKHLKKKANKAAPELNSFIEEVGIL